MPVRGDGLESQGPTSMVIRRAAGARLRRGGSGCDQRKGPPAIAKSSRPVDAAIGVDVVLWWRSMLTDFTSGIDESTHVIAVHLLGKWPTLSIGSLISVPLSGRDRGAVREFSARPQVLSGGQPSHSVWRILTGSKGK